MLDQQQPDSCLLQPKGLTFVCTPAKVAFGLHPHFYFTSQQHTKMLAPILAAFPKQDKAARPLWLLAPALSRAAPALPAVRLRLLAGQAPLCPCPKGRAAYAPAKHEMAPTSGSLQEAAGDESRAAATAAGTDPARPSEPISTWHTEVSQPLGHPEHGHSAGRGRRRLRGAAAGGGGARSPPSRPPALLRQHRRHRMATARPARAGRAPAAIPGAPQAGGQPGGRRARPYAPGRTGPGPTEASSPQVPAGPGAAARMPGAAPVKVSRGLAGGRAGGDSRTCGRERP